MARKDVSKQSRVLIIGAGPAGIAMAVILKQMGFTPYIFEERSLNRLCEQSNARSINITLGERGSLTLQKMGCLDEIFSESAIVKGRSYRMDDSEHFVPYSLLQGRQLHSIKRSTLERILINCADAHDIDIHFGHKLVGIDVSQKKCKFSRSGCDVAVDYDFVFGADGANSAVRNILHAESLITTCEYVYKRIEIEKDNADRLKLNLEAVNIWPNSRGMLLTLPNLDGSHSGLLHIKNETLDSIYQDPELLKQYFPVLIEEVDDFSSKFFSSPEGAFRSLKCNKWFLRNSILLIGDSGHFLSPFLGQGTSAALEDVRIFSSLLEDQLGDLFSAAFIFSNTRPKATDAISAASDQNLKNLEADFDFVDFLTFKALDLALERKFSEYCTEYSMIAFHSIPYDEALKVAKLCRPVLADYSQREGFKGKTDFSDEQLEEVYAQIKAALLTQNYKHENSKS